MTDRCWEELRRAGTEIAKGGAPGQIAEEIAVYFDLPQSPEAEAVQVFLNGLLCNLEDEMPALDEAAQ